MLVAGCWLRTGGAAGGWNLLRNNFVGFVLGGAGGGALLFGKVGTLGGERFALARGGLPSYRASGGSGAGGAALLWRVDA